MVYIQLPKTFCFQLSVSSLKECLQLPNQWINNTASELGANDNIHLCKIQSVPASDSCSADDAALARDLRRFENDR